MITCPVCEHTQAGGDECELCGKRFAPRAAAGGDGPRLAELELTHHASSRAPVATERLPELEMTAFRGGPDLPVTGFPEMERTRVDPGAVDVDAPEMVDLDRGRAPDDGARTEIPWGAVICRYCRHEQAEGAICDSCGMRLPRFGPDGTAAATTGPAVPDGLRVRCKCGSPAKPGERCGNCGDLVAVPTGV